MIKNFIERPVLATVVSIIIVLLGILGLATLPITQYPEIAPPTITVTTNYPGANAETVLNSVIIPIEEEINGVEGMTYISSTSTNDGFAEIEVYFKQSMDADIAAVNVQNRVARATPLLPPEVVRGGIVTQKRQNSPLIIITYYSTNEEYDDTFIQNYMSINIVPELKRIDGVGDVSIIGAKDYSMRVWLDPSKLSFYSLVPSDIELALRQQSLEAAPGKLGENSGQSFQYVIKYSGRYKTEEQYENIVIKSLPNGRVLKLKDVARIEMAALGYSVAIDNNGYPAVAMRVFQTAGEGSNAQSIINSVKEKLDERTNPKGIVHVINYDTNTFLEASISSVTRTLIEATLLVLLVVFIFLQDLRSTIIPAIAIPVSIIGAFFFFQLFGYSINLLTLFALILAIGIVVDDAIVVVEAVHTKMEETGKSPKEATIEAMGEITGAIISISLIMAAVFIPVTFVQGPTGVFYQQFGVTLMAAIAISAVNALTLVPALCAIFLKTKSKEDTAKPKSFVSKSHAAFNNGFGAIVKSYGKRVSFLIKHKWITGGIIAFAMIAIWFVNGITPKGFVPNEDRGVIFASIEMAPGTSTDRSHQLTQNFRDKIKDMPGTNNFTFVNGFGILSGVGSNFSSGFIKLDTWDERGKQKGQTLDEITGQMYGVAATMPDANMIFFGAPSIPGFGNVSGFEIVLLDRTGGELAELDKVTRTYMGELMKRPEIMYAQSSFNTNYAQYELDIDIIRAEESGVTIRDILSVLQGYIGGYYAADFTRFGKQYRVMLQALPEERTNINSLENIYVRTASGKMSPIIQFVSFKRVYGPQAVTRFNLFTSATINGAPNFGYSSGDAITALQEVAKSSLPVGYDIDYSGLTREEVNSGSQTLFIFILSLLFIYFILCALYESYLLPLAVILSLPLGIMGAYTAQLLGGLENNIYFQIGLIMLIGLLAKNAILIVEFAIQRRRRGETIIDSAINAAKTRLRPILMTSLAFIMGVTPLVISTGAGAVGNRSISTGVAFGLLIGTVLGVIVIPTLYVIFQTLQEKITPSKFHDKKKIITKR